MILRNTSYHMKVKETSIYLFKVEAEVYALAEKQDMQKKKHLMAAAEAAAVVPENDPTPTACMLSITN